MNELAPQRDLIINRAFATASKWTFTIRPIKELLSRYVGNGKEWIDPFAGANSPAEFTNDLNEDMPTTYHMFAEEFVDMLDGPFKGILFDPPYSYRQIKESYNGLGLPVDRFDTSYNFYGRVISVISPKIETGGYAISFGWCSNGLGQKYGFRIIEILLVAHGLHHNDTIVTVERKLQ